MSFALTPTRWKCTFSLKQWCSKTVSLSQSSCRTRCEFFMLTVDTTWKRSTLFRLKRQRRLRCLLLTWIQTGFREGEEKRRTRENLGPCGQLSRIRNTTLNSVQGYKLHQGGSGTSLQETLLTEENTELKYNNTELNHQAQMMSLHHCALLKW